jgi:hypothetical protein
LNIAKTFIIGFVNPIETLINLLLSSLEELLTNLFKVSIHLTGDIRPLYPFEDLVGGYSEFEKRMTAKLLDRTDPTYPAIVEGDQILAVFAYSSSDVRMIQDIISKISSLYSFFDVKLALPTALASPTLPEVAYYGYFDEDEDLTNTGYMLSVSWGLRPPITNRGNVQVVPPSGFLVEVSTVRDGLKVFYSKDMPSRTGATDPGGNTIPDRYTGIVDVQGKGPLTLYGGYDQVEVEEPYNSTVSVVDGKLEPLAGKVQVFTQITSSDNIPIPLDMLYDSTTGHYFFQRSFYVSSSDVLGILDPPASVSFLNKCKYSLQIMPSDLPYEAQVSIGSSGIVLTEGLQPATYYVRVSPVSSNITSEKDFKYKFTSSDLKTKGRATVVEGFSISDRGDSTAPVDLQIPTTNTQECIDLLKTALAVLLLSRSDVEVSSTPRINTSAKSSGLEKFKNLFLNLVDTPQEYFEMLTDSSMISFRKSIMSRCDRVAKTLFNKVNLSKSMINTLVSSCSLLNTWKFTDVVGLDRRYLSNDGNYSADFTVQEEEEVNYISNYYTVPNLTIWEALEDNDSSVGVGRNPLVSNLGLEREGLPSDRIRRIIPGFHEFQQGGCSCDYSPVFVLSPRTISPLNARPLSNLGVYIRNCFDTSIYSAANAILNVFSGAIDKNYATEGGWISSDFSQYFYFISDLLMPIKAMADSLVDGTKLASQIIVDYITFYESKLLEIQRLIDQIDMSISLIDSLEIPNVYAYLTAGNSMQEIASNFMSAENKPFDSSTNYGVGFVLLFTAQTVGSSFILDFIYDVLQVTGVP